MCEVVYVGLIYVFINFSLIFCVAENASRVSYNYAKVGI